MARGTSEFSGKKMRFFDCKPVLPKMNEPLNVEGMGTFTLKTRVQIDESGQIVRDKTAKQIPQFIKNRPNINPATKKTVMIYPPVMSMDSDVWDYVRPENALSGYLVAVDVNEYVNQGETVHSYSLMLKDPSVEEIYKISFNFNKVSYKFLNSFFNLDFGTPDEPIVHWLKVRLGKYTGSDGNDYASLFLYRAASEKESNDPVAWKYSLNKETGLWESEDGDVMPQIEKIATKGGKEISDDTELQNWCIEKLQTISQILENLKVNDDGKIVSGKTISNPEMEEDGVSTTATASSNPNVEDETDSEDYGDDLPF